MLPGNTKLGIHSVSAVIIQGCHMKEIFDVFCLIPVAELRPMNGNVREHNKRKHSALDRVVQRWNGLRPMRLSPSEE